MSVTSAQLRRPPIRERIPLGWLRAPLRADTWRRTAYALLAPAVALISVPLALFGGPAGRLQRATARTLLGLPLAERGRTPVRALVHAVLALPLSLLTLLITGYGWSIVVLNLAYPARPLFGMPAGGEGTWGGPTMVGAWAFHALFGGLGFLLLMPWVVRGLTGAQGRLLRGVLG